MIIVTFPISGSVLKSLGEGLQVLFYASVTLVEGNSGLIESEHRPSGNFSLKRTKNHEFLDFLFGK